MLKRTDRSKLAQWVWTVDYVTLSLSLLLIGVGMIMVMAASPPVAERINLSEYHFIIRQSIFAVPAIAIMLVISMLSVRSIRAISIIGLIFFGSLMVATVLFAPEVKGATRWLSISGFRIQPSEFAKPFFAIVCAWLLGLWRESDEFPGWVWASGIAGSLVILLLLQPDVGMTALLLATWGFQMFLAGLPLIFVMIAVFLLPIAVISAYFLLDHVQVRVDHFFNGTSMQVQRSYQSFAEGGFNGVGPGNGSVKHYLPDAHADFIFSVMAEEYGLITCLFVILIYLCIVLRNFAKCYGAQDMFSILAISGLTVQFSLQTFINMASSMSLIPTKGMTLPFISYGGSSLITSCITVGLIVALTRSQSISFAPLPTHDRRAA